MHVLNSPNTHLQTSTHELKQQLKRLYHEEQQFHTFLRYSDEQLKLDHLDEALRGFFNSPNNYTYSEFMQQVRVCCLKRCS